MENRIKPNSIEQSLTTPEACSLFSGYKYLIFFSMLYVCFMICNATLTNRYISLSKDIFILGGTLTSPLTFILGDIIAEIFGYKIAKQTIWCGFICEAIFAAICGSVARAPYPDFFKDYNAYSSIFGQLWYIVISSFIAFVVSGLVNIRIITRWKFLLQGRYFWFRSLASSTIAEALYSIIAILMMELGSIPLSYVWKVILVSYLIKVAYSITLAWPGSVIVNYIKLVSKIDVYDYPTSYNPFKKTNYALRTEKI
jgi:uncharacterized integral membrane protein (TIGR00697 family)